MATRTLPLLSLLLASLTTAINLPRQDWSDIASLPTVPSPPSLSHSSTSTSTSPFTTPTTTASTSSCTIPGLPALARQNIFCSPTPDTHWGYDFAYEVTWDTRYEPPNSSLIIEVFATDYFIETEDQYPERAGHALWRTRNTTSGRGGGSTVRTRKEWLEGGRDTNVTIVLRTYVEDNNDGEDERPVTRAGPTVLLLNKKGSEVHEGGGHGGSGLDKKVGVPVAVIVFIVLVGVVVFFLLLRRRKNKNKGVGSAKRRQSGAAGGLVGPFKSVVAPLQGRRGHKREKSASWGEPTLGKDGEWVGGGGRGVELQEQGHRQGHVRQGSDWGWGAGGLGSPKGGEGDGGGNVFREEVGRQQGARGW